MMTRRHHDRNLRSCEIVFQRGGYDVETLYWAGSIEEVRELAQKIAFRGGADTYRIIELPTGLGTLTQRKHCSDALHLNSRSEKERGRGPVQ
jgi:hypothetical protein